MTTYAQQHGKLSELIQQFEADTEANPTDIKALEDLSTALHASSNTTTRQIKLLNG